MNDKSITVIYNARSLTVLYTYKSGNIKFVIVLSLIILLLIPLSDVTCHKMGEQLKIKILIKMDGFPIERRKYFD